MRIRTRTRTRTRIWIQIWIRTWITATDTIVIIVVRILERACDATDSGAVDSYAVVPPALQIAIVGATILPLGLGSGLGLW